MLASATSVTQGVLGLAAVAVLYIWPFFVAHRIGVRTGRQWFWYALFLGWFGVILLAMLGPRPGAPRTSGFGSTYHVPPEVARRQRAQRKR